MEKSRNFSSHFLYYIEILVDPKLQNSLANIKHFLRCSSGTNNIENIKNYNIYLEAKESIQVTQF